MPGPGRGARLAAGASALAAAAVLLWFSLGMHRGLLLSADIRTRCWPWSPYLTAGPIAAPALSDPVWQFVPWVELARRQIAAGALPLWNPHQDGGVPLLGNAQSALGSPLLAPALLFGVANGWNLSLLLRILLALCGTYLWLRDFGRSREASVLGACVFALSGPFVAWLEHPHTLAAAAVPLLVFFAGRLSRQASPAGFAGVAAATFLVLSGGHPETQLLAALLATALLAFHAGRGNRPGRAVGASLIGAGLAAPLLFPFLEYLRASAAAANAGRRAFTLPLRDLLRFLAPRLSGSNVIEAAATVSVTALALAVVGAVVLRRERAMAWACLCAAAILLVVYDNPVSRALAVSTPVYWTRSLLLLPLPAALLASGGLDAVFTSSWLRGAPAAPARAGPWLIVLLCAGELLAAARGVHGSAPVRLLAPSTPLLDRLRSDPEVFRVLPLHTMLSPNSATDYGLDDVRGYDALAPRGWRQRRREIGEFKRVPTQEDAIAPWDLAPGGSGLDFWNVKYLLLAPQFAFGAETLNVKKGLDLEQVYSGPDGKILKNRRALPRARLSGTGRARILERRADRWLLETEADAPRTFLLANPFFPGWEARLDGNRVDLSLSPGDPITLPVPAGRHRVEVAYRPESFRAGLAVAAASAVLLLLVLARRRGRIS